jgi:hypothetical protein
LSLSDALSSALNQRLVLKLTQCWTELLPISPPLAPCPQPRRLLREYPSQHLVHKLTCAGQNCFRSGIGIRSGYQCLRLLREYSSQLLVLKLTCAA